MPNLTIDNATVGYDTAGVRSLLDKIKAEVIHDAETAMKQKAINLFNAVDEVWRGVSAEKFKANMQQDIDKIIEALDASYNSLDAEVSQIAKAMGDVDVELVEARTAA